MAGKPQQAAEPLFDAYFRLQIMLKYTIQVRF